MKSSLNFDSTLQDHHNNHKKLNHNLSPKQLALFLDEAVNDNMPLDMTKHFGKGMKQMTKVADFRSHKKKHGSHKRGFAA